MAILKIRNAADTGWIELGGIGTIYQGDSPPASPHAGQLWLDTDADPVWNYWIYGSEVATTSGTTVELITDLPSDIAELEILFNGISTNTANKSPIVQLGDSSGYYTTGYESFITYYSGCELDTNGLYLHDTANWGAADVLTGWLRLMRFELTQHLWISTGHMLSPSESQPRAQSGFMTTTYSLSKIRLNTSDGTASFDLGSAIVRYRR